MKTDIPALFGGLPMAAAKEEMQHVLSIGFKVIDQHKGDWTKTEVEQLIIDLNKLAMERFFDRGFIVRVQKEVEK